MSIVSSQHQTQATVRALRMPWRIAALTIVLAGACASTYADDDASDAKGRAKAAYSLITEQVEQVQIKFADGDGATLQRQPKSLLRWSNPVLGSVYGEVFVWTHDGKPHVIGSSFRFYSPTPQCSIEFQSISTRPLVATYKDQVAWAPTKGGVEWKPIPGAAPPSSRASVRLLQMRKLSKQFSGVTIDRNDETIERRMNLKTAPLYRYPGSKSTLDGAIFGLAQGTDPEIALLIETQESERGPQWMYAFARQNSIAMRCRHKDQLVWDQPRLAPPWDNVRLTTEPYILFTFIGPDELESDSPEQ